MIIYFSATGNSKYAAKRIADSIDDKIVSILDCIDENIYEFEDEKIGIISPTYFWGFPSIMKEFLEKIKIRTNYLYVTATYGTTPGATGAIADELIKEKDVDAYFCIKMADSWTPIYDVSKPEKVFEFTKNTESEIDYIIKSIKNNFRNEKMQNSVPKFLVDAVAQPLYNLNARKTSKLSVEKTCIGCGLCEKKCPVHAIKIENKKPVWIKERCVMCLRCLHICPTFSIQRGKNTKKHGQYLNPNVEI